MMQPAHVLWVVSAPGSVLTFVDAVHPAVYPVLLVTPFATGLGLSYSGNMCMGRARRICSSSADRRRRRGRRVVGVPCVPKPVLRGHPIDPFRPAEDV